jgi:hypothetical protein
MLSSETYLNLTYKTAGDFKTITLTASNDFSSANHIINIEFDGNGTKKFPWYFIVIIVLSGILIFGLVILGYKSYRKRIEDKKKISLISEGE